MGEKQREILLHRLYFASRFLLKCLSEEGCFIVLQPTDVTLQWLISKGGHLLDTHRSLFDSSSKVSHFRVGECVFGLGTTFFFFFSSKKAVCVESIKKKRKMGLKKDRMGCEEKDVGRVVGESTRAGALLFSWWLVGVAIMKRVLRDSR